MFDKKCMDYDTTTGNVLMKECTGGDTQQWYFNYEALLPKSDASRCLHMDLTEITGTNIILKPCRWANNQKFYWDGQRVRARMGIRSYCLEYDLETSNVKVGICKKNKKAQQWRESEEATKAATYTTTTTTRPPAHLRTEQDDLCMDYANATDGNVFMNTCSDSPTQFWYRDGPAIKSVNDPSRCLHYDISGWSSVNVKMFDCRYARNQQFTHDAKKGTLNVAYASGKCVEYDVETKNVIMQKCQEDKKTQKWLAIRE